METNNNTPRVLARLTSEELSSINGGLPCCPRHQTVAPDCSDDVGGYTVILDTGTCD